MYHQYEVGIFKKFKILKAAIRSGGFWYATYLQFEAIFSKYFCKKKFKNNKIQKFAMTLNIPMIVVENLNLETLKEHFDLYKPELILSVRPGLIFKNCFIKYSCQIINVHCSALPSYAGIGGILRAMANDEKLIGISLHIIDVKPLMREKFYRKIIQ